MGRENKISHDDKRGKHVSPNSSTAVLIIVIPVITMAVVKVVERHVHIAVVFAVVVHRNNNHHKCVR